MMNFFDSEFYRMADQLAVEVEALKTTQPRFRYRTYAEASQEVFEALRIISVSVQEAADALGEYWQQAIAGQTRCIVCGANAIHIVPDGDYKYLAVCEEHYYPAYRIKLYLAWEDFRQVLVDEWVRFTDWLTGER